MAAKQDRSNKYYLDRLKRDFPVIHADLVAGRYKSVRDAAIAAGLRKAPTPLKTMLAAWNKASAAERAEFLRMIGASSGAASGPAVVAPIAVGDRLTPSGKARIEAAIMTRGLSTGGVMKELGFKSRDTSLGMALQSGTALKAGLISALGLWLTKHL